jgi:hypothetical protein
MITITNDTIKVGDTAVVENNIKGLTGYDISKGTIEERLLNLNSILLTATAVVTYTRTQSADGGRTKYRYIYFNVTPSSFTPVKVTYNGKTYTVYTNTNTSYSGAYYISLSNVGNTASEVSYPAAPAIGTTLNVE